MNRTITLLIVLSCCCSTALIAQSKPKARYPYLLYLPPSYNNTKSSFPLVIYLHGGSQKGTDLNKLKEYGLPRMIDEGRQFDFIIAAPQCPAERYWSTADWFDSLYQDLATRYRIDTSRVYVTGISMGGFGTWHAAMDHPTKIAAIVPLCGGCNDSAQICRIRNIPVWTFHGTSDTVIDIDETQRLVNRLQQCGGLVRFTKLENEGHRIQYLFERKEIYDWMLQQVKN